MAFEIKKAGNWATVWEYDDDEGNHAEAWSTQSLIDILRAKGLAEPLSWWENPPFVMGIVVLAFIISGFLSVTTVNVANAIWPRKDHHAEQEATKKKSQTTKRSYKSEAESNASRKTPSTTAVELRDRGWNLDGPEVRRPILDGPVQLIEGPVPAEE